MIDILNFLLLFFFNLLNTSIYWVLETNFSKDHKVVAHRLYPPEVLSLSIWIFFVFFKFLAMPHSMWDLSSLTGGQTHVPCSGNLES